MTFAQDQAQRAREKRMDLHHFQERAFHIARVQVALDGIVAAAVERFKATQR